MYQKVSTNLNFVDREKKTDFMTDRRQQTANRISVTC